MPRETKHRDPACQTRATPTRSCPSSRRGSTVLIGHVDSTDAVPSADIQETETVDLIQRIQNVVFRTTRLRAGYNEREVDTFLDRVIAVLREGRDLEGLRNPRFSTTRLSPGYDMEDVDNFLREIELIG
jgi:DivIVA domain-containing protein